MQLAPRKVSYRPAWSAGRDRSEEVESGDAPLARRLWGALTAGSGGGVKAIRRLESARNGHAHTSRPGRLAAVSASVWPCRPGSRLTCAPLFCALVIPSALLSNVLWSGSPVSPTCVVRRASGGRSRTRLALMPPQPLSVATKGTASAPCAQERHRIYRASSQWPFS